MILALGVVCVCCTQYFAFIPGREDTKYRTKRSARDIFWFRRREFSILATRINWWKRHESENKSDDLEWNESNGTRAVSVSVKIAKFENAVLSPVEHMFKMTFRVPDPPHTIFNPTDNHAAHIIFGRANRVRITTTSTTHHTNITQFSCGVNGRHSFLLYAMHIQNYTMIYSSGRKRKSYLGVIK